MSERVIEEEELEGLEAVIAERLLDGGSYWADGRGKVTLRQAIEQAKKYARLFGDRDLSQSEDGPAARVMRELFLRANRKMGPLALTDSLAVELCQEVSKLIVSVRELQEKVEGKESARPEAGSRLIVVHRAGEMNMDETKIQTCADCPTIIEDRGGISFVPDILVAPNEGEATPRFEWIGDRPLRPNERRCNA